MTLIGWGGSLGSLVYHIHCVAVSYYSDRDFCGLTLVTQASWNDEQLVYVFKTYIFSTALYIFPYKFLIYQLYVGRLCVRMVLNRGFYWNHLGSLKMPTTGSHHQLFWFIWTGGQPEHEDFEKHPGGSNEQPRLTTTDLSQVFLSKMSWVLTVHGLLIMRVVSKSHYALRT